jgi:hypothetical protein
MRFFDDLELHQTQSYKCGWSALRGWWGMLFQNLEILSEKTDALLVVLLQIVMY